MRYLSPKTLMGHDLTGTLDVKALQLHRKKILAELELSADGQLTINQKAYGKNDILEYFKTLEDPTVVGYHQAVSEDPVLLRFLQAATIDEDATFQAAALYTDPAFIDWLSPYFYSAFITLTADCFEELKPRTMWTIFQNTLLMTATETQRAWLFIIGILEKNIALFEHYKNRLNPGSAKMMPVVHIIPFVGQAYLNVIKELPDSRFAGWKDKYAFSIQYPALAGYNRDGRQSYNAVRWLKDAEKLAVSENIKSLLRNKTKELEAGLKRLEKKRSRTAAAILAVGVVVITSIIGIFNHFDTDTPPPPTPPTLQQPGILPKTLDPASAPEDSLAIRVHRDA